MATRSGGTLERAHKARRERVTPGAARAGEPRRFVAAQVAVPQEDDLAGANRALREELAALRGEQAKLKQAIFEAAQVQRRLCAPRELCWGEFEVAGEIFPVRHLSGDFFKVLDLGSDLGLVVGDIAGKGLSAGLWLTHLMGLIQRCAREYADPAEAVAEVNRELCEGAGEPPMTALFFARIEPQRGDLVYCSAGLPAPLLLRRDRSMQSLQEGGPMLGALREATFGAGRVRLDPGDTLVAYSDGVIECQNSRDEQFDTKRLSAAAGAASNASASQALFSTLGAVLDFADGCPPGDDLTLLVVHRREGTPKGRAHSCGEDSSTTFGGQAAVMQPRKAAQRGFVSKQVS